MLKHKLMLTFLLASCSIFTMSVQTPQEIDINAEAEKSIIKTNCSKCSQEFEMNLNEDVCCCDGECHTYECDNCASYTFPLICTPYWPTINSLKKELRAAKSLYDNVQLPDRSSFKTLIEDADKNISHLITLASKGSSIKLPYRKSNLQIVEQKSREFASLLEACKSNLEELRSSISSFEKQGYQPYNILTKGNSRKGFRSCEKRKAKRLFKEERLLDEKEALCSEEQFPGEEDAFEIEDRLLNKLDRLKSKRQKLPTIYIQEKQSKAELAKERRINTNRLGKELEKNPLYYSEDEDQGEPEESDEDDHRVKRKVSMYISLARCVAQRLEKALFLGLKDVNYNDIERAEKLRLRLEKKRFEIDNFELTCWEINTLANRYASLKQRFIDEDNKNTIYKKVIATLQHLRKEKRKLDKEEALCFEEQFPGEFEAFETEERILNQLQRKHKKHEQ